MNDNKLIRVENLNRLELKAAELATRLGRGTSYWHGMLSGARPFGEKVARDIEEKLDLRRGCLDEDGGAGPIQPAPYRPSGFALALAVLYDSLPEDDAVRSIAWVNAQQAIEQARGLQSSPAADVPAPGRAAKQRHE